MNPASSAIHRRPVPLFPVVEIAWSPEARCWPEFARVPMPAQWYLNHRPELANLGVALDRSRARGDRRRSVAAPAPSREGVSSSGLTRGRRSSCHRLRHSGLSPYRRDVSRPSFSAQNRVRQLSAPAPVNSPASFGGNSNWRTIWLMNFLVIESLQKFHHYYGDGHQDRCPTGSGRYCDQESPTSTPATDAAVPARSEDWLAARS